VRILWGHLYGDVDGVLGLFSGARSASGSKRLDDARSAYFDYPAGVDGAQGWCSRQSRAGREVYFCAHLLVRRRRIKENAAPLLALYVDGDGAKPAVDMPVPTAVVESSPGREQFYFRLTEPVPPAFGERLKRRLTLAMVADDSGWDLTQLLRPPGTRNRKYPQVPAVRLIEINDLRYDPGELDRLLPPEPNDRPKSAVPRAHRPDNVGPAPELSSLSWRMRDLIRHGNSDDYRSRSEVDMAACVAMFGAGFEEAQVWAVMTDPTNGISEKYFEKGRQGERYLALTIGKAANTAWGETPRSGRSKARRVRRTARV
jgi:hypothetical protein